MQTLIQLGKKYKIIYVQAVDAVNTLYILELFTQMSIFSVYTKKL